MILTNKRLNKITVPKAERGSPSSSFSNSIMVQYPSLEDNERYLASEDLANKVIMNNISTITLAIYFFKKNKWWAKKTNPGPSYFTRNLHW